MFNVSDDVVVTERPYGWLNAGWFADQNLNKMVFRVVSTGRAAALISRLQPNGKPSKHKRRMENKFLRHVNLKPLEDYL